MGLFSFLFGNKNNKIKDFAKRGAIIVDVRSKAEYASGAIPGSKHIDLKDIPNQANSIKNWNLPIITCCLSGGRSGRAAKILKQHHIEVINGGGWQSLYKKL